MGWMTFFQVQQVFALCVGTVVMENVCHIGLLKKVFAQQDVVVIVCWKITRCFPSNNPSNFSVVVFFLFVETLDYGKLKTDKLHLILKK